MSRSLSRQKHLDNNFKSHNYHGDFDVNSTSSMRSGTAVAAFASNTLAYNTNHSGSLIIQDNMASSASQQPRNSLMVNANLRSNSLRGTLSVGNLS